MSILSCFKKVSKSFLVTITSIFLLISPTSAIYALDESLLDFYAENNIFFYDPDDNMELKNNCFIGTGDEITNISKAAIIIWNKLNTFLTPEQAAGVMGNMQHESLLNPAQHEVSQRDDFPEFNIESDISQPYGLGLVQWSWGRRVGMISYIRDKEKEKGRKKTSLVEYLKNPDKYSINYEINGQKLLDMIGEEDFTELVDFQIDYLKKELDTNNEYKGFYKTGKSGTPKQKVEQSTNYFLEKIEIPADIELKRPQRIESAHTFYKISSGCGGLKSGGMNLEEAKEFMKIYRDAARKTQGIKSDITLSINGNLNISNINNNDPLVQAISYESPAGPLNNCSSFVQWFLNAYTTIGPKSQTRYNGYEEVDQLISTYNLKPANKDTNGRSIPRPYSIMSIGPYTGGIGTDNDGQGYQNHTVVILGIDKERNKLIVGEASFGTFDSDYPGAHEYDLEKYTRTGKDFHPKYAYTDDILNTSLKGK